MNEIDFIRQQLALERAHLQQILHAVRHGSAGVRNSRAVAAYIDWASRRLLEQLDADARTQWAELSGAAQDEHLLARLAAWRDSLETPAAHTPRIAQWRQVARLSADSILEERQLYAAARAEAGLS
jgi:hypothetical protein